MRTNLSLILLLIIGAYSQAVRDIPKLPIYVGRSYDLLVGNPLSNEVDPGFQHEIFMFTYNNYEQTEDGKYLIPDGVSHRKVSSCSFSTDVTAYRGTETYQSQLKTKATVEGGYSGLLVKGSFSMSTTYEKVEKETTVSNNTLTHATAECEAYELSIDLFKVATFQPNFIAAVNESYHSGNWDKFVTQFGTHFVYDVTMGGRATQEISYDYQSVSKMSSIGIDINMAAKASFAKFFLDTSFDWHKYTEDISYAEKLSQTTDELYIGGEPPKDGDIHTWVTQVINNPMPIKYKVLDTSELFSRITTLDIDVSEAMNQYHTALDKYCVRVGCRSPIPDKPKPPPATISIEKMPAFGGNGGSPFEFKFDSTTMGAVKFVLRHGAGIDNLQIVLGDGVRNLVTPAQGGNGGGPAEWVVPAGQYVQQVEYRSGDRVDSLTFVTNKGVKSPYFGGGGGSYHLETFPDGYRIIGFYGRSGSRLDQVGFILAKTIYPNPQGEPQIDIIRKSLSTQ